MPPRSVTLFGPILLATAGDDVLTVPTDRVAILKRLAVANNTSTARTFEVLLDNGTSGRLMRGVPVGAGLSLDIEVWWALAEGDVLRVNPSSGPSHLTVTGFGALLLGDAM